jgi:hypothetical protein
MTGFGGEIVDQFLFELFEDGEVFSGQRDDLAGDTVAGGVQTGLVPAVGGSRASGFLRVGLIGRDLFFCRHVRSSNCRGVCPTIYEYHASG